MAANWTTNSGHSRPQIGPHVCVAPWSQKDHKLDRNFISSGKQKRQTGDKRSKRDAEGTQQYFHVIGQMGPQKGVQMGPRKVTAEYRKGGGVVARERIISALSPLRGSKTHIRIGPEPLRFVSQLCVPLNRGRIFLVAQRKLWARVLAAPRLRRHIFKHPKFGPTAHDSCHSCPFCGAKRATTKRGPCRGEISVQY